MFRHHKRIEVESTLERDFVLRHAFMRDVEDVVPQPVVLEWTSLDGRRYTYTPDFIVYWCKDPDGRERKPWLVEVKPAAEWRAHWRKWLPKWKAARRYAESIGARFRIFDETRIRDQLMVNINFLSRYTRVRADDRLVTEIVATAQTLGEVPAGVLARSVGAARQVPDDVLMLLWHLVAIRQLDCEMTEPISERTAVWRPSNV